MRPCYAFKAATETAPAVLSIFDEIGGWGVQAKDFISQLSASQGKKLQVEINSPGGDVFAGLAMYNALRASGKEITTKVMGVAASAASLIFMAGDIREMPKNSFLMIHNPWTFAMGNAEELRETADTLDSIGNALRGTYGARSGMDDAVLAEMLSKDTWLSADESIEHGLATLVTDEIEAKAMFDMARAELPLQVAAIFKAAEAPAEQAVVVEELAAKPEVEEVVNPLADQIAAMATSAGFQPYAAVLALTDGVTLESVKARLGEMAEIKSLCAVAQLPEQADKLLAEGKTLVQARTHLQSLRAAADEARSTDTTRKTSNQPANSASPSAGLTTADIWAKRNSKHKGV